MTEDKSARKLRKELENALARQKDDDAIELLGELMTADPKSPRWPHKRGDLYRKKNRKKEAVECYTVAAGLYADQGFLARAVAMAKTVVDLDPTQLEVLERIDPEAARKLNRQQRSAVKVSNRPAAHSALLDEGAIPPLPGPRHPAVLAEGGGGPPPPPPPRRAHPALLADDEAAPARKHPAVLLEDDAPAHPAVAPEMPARARPAPRADSGAVLPPLPAPPQKRTGDRVRAALKRQAVEDDLGAGADVLRMPSPPRMPDLSHSVMDMAEELKVAPDVRPNETRFSNAPPARQISVNLTDLEVRPRKPAPPPESLKPPPSAKKLSKLPLFPLFAEIPQGALVELVKGAELLELAEGQFVMRKGDAADALFGIVEGSVDVVVPGQVSKMTLAEGDVFGESCLLAGEKRHADVIVRGHLLALRISRQVINQMLASYPRLAEILLELLTRRLLGNLLAASPLFQEFDARGRQQLAQMFEIRRAPRGMMLAEAGKQMDGLYISLTGVLEVHYGDGRTPEHHEPGTMLGQACLLTQEPSDISVLTMANMLVLRLPAQTFHAIVMQYPGMLAHISDLAASSVAKVMI
jgi:CRP-like cAMP-binding protein